MLGRSRRREDFGSRNSEFGIRNFITPSHHHTITIRNSEFGIRISDFGIATRRCPRSISDFGFRISEFGIWNFITPSHHHNSEFGIRNSEFHPARPPINFGFRISDFGFVGAGQGDSEREARIPAIEPTPRPCRFNRRISTHPKTCHFDRASPTTERRNLWRQDLRKRNLFPPRDFSTAHPSGAPLEMT